MNNIKKPSNSTTVYIKDLNANDSFITPGRETVYVVESRRTDGPMTRIDYRIPGTEGHFAFVKPSLSTAYLLTD